MKKSGIGRTVSADAAGSHAVSAFLLIPFLPDALKGALMMILILIMTAVPFIGSYLIYHQKYGGKS